MAEMKVDEATSLFPLFDGVPCVAVQRVKGSRITMTDKGGAALRGRIECSLEHEAGLAFYIEKHNLGTSYPVP